MLRPARREGLAGIQMNARASPARGSLNIAGIQSETLKERLPDQVTPAG